MLTHELSWLRFPFLLSIIPSTGINNSSVSCIVHEEALECLICGLFFVCLFVLNITKPSTYDWWCLLSSDLICWIKYRHIFKGHARFFQFKGICIYTPISIIYWFKFSETNHNFKCLFLLEDISLRPYIEYMFSFLRAWQCTWSACYEQNESHVFKRTG